VNIVLTNEYFPPFAPGGAEWSTLQLGKALAARGHGVTVITPNFGAPAREIVDGIHVVRFPYPARLQGQRTLQLRWLAMPAFYAWSAAQIAREAGRARADVLHAQNKYMLPGTWLAARWRRRPVVVTLRDTSLLCALGRCLMRYDDVPAGCGRGALWRLCREEHIERYLHPRTRWQRWRARVATDYLHGDERLRRWVLARVDGVIAVSHGTLALYRQAGVRLGRHSGVVYNIPPDLPELVDSTPAGLDQLRVRYGLVRGPLVLYVGKFSPGKGTPDLVAAASEVAQRVPDAQFVFVGGTELPGAPDDGQRLRVLGRLPNDEVLALYQLADLVVVPSVSPESLSRVLLESLAAGRAVVGTRVGGTPELIEDDHNGLLVPRSSPRALAQAITRLLENPQERARMGRAGRRLLEQRFDAGRSIEALLDFYRLVGPAR
jgi:glycosyltransferase involved in cell wall biosynthesis